MRQVQYKTFSLETHKRNWRINRPNVCQFELTFGCGLHCRHCYTDCYNKPEHLEQELNTDKVKLILNKVYKAGCIWLCFTGGDPLTRPDFLELYSYAKDKGFIVTIFTNAYSMTKEISAYLKKKPPFVIEMTLNGVSEDVYEKISQVKGSFQKAMLGIDYILKAKLPLKIKTQISKDNFDEVPAIEKFIESLGLKFRPGADFFPRLNGDLHPCSLRVSPEKLLSLQVIRKPLFDESCKQIVPADNRKLNNKLNIVNPDLFSCAIGGGDGINVDPYGNIFLCELIRKPSFNLLETEIGEAMNRLLPLVRNGKFSASSKCGDCNQRGYCRNCPGRALLETGLMESPVEYYCKLAEQ